MDMVFIGGDAHAGRIILRQVTANPVFVRLQDPVLPAQRPEGFNPVRAAHDGVTRRIARDGDEQRGMRQSAFSDAGREPGDMGGIRLAPVRPVPETHRERREHEHARRVCRRLIGGRILNSDRLLIHAGARAL